mgnify:CR=1 FL=1
MEIVYDFFGMYLLKKSYTIFYDILLLDICIILKYSNLVGIKGNEGEI